MTPRIPRDWRLPVAALACVGLVLLGSTIWGRINEASHLNGLDLGVRQNVAVSLAFEPERFHIEAFQEVGRYQGWSDGRARIMSANPEALRQLARNYWVRDIEILEDGT